MCALRGKFDGGHFSRGTPRSGIEVAGILCARDSEVNYAQRENV